MNWWMTSTNENLSQKGLLRLASVMAVYPMRLDTRLSGFHPMQKCSMTGVQVPLFYLLIVQGYL